MAGLPRRPAHCPPLAAVEPAHGPGGRQPGLDPAGQHPGPRRAGATGPQPQPHDRPPAKARPRAAAVPRKPGGAGRTPHPGAAAGHRSSTTGQPRQVGFSGPHEPRNPHPDERHRRPEQAAAQDRADRPPARLPGEGDLCLGNAAGPDQRHPGLLAHRSGQAGGREHRFRPRSGHARRFQPDGATRPAKGAGAALPSRTGRAPAPARRPAAPDASAGEPGQQRHQVHRVWRDHPAHRPAGPAGRAGTAGVFRAGFGHGHSRRAPGPALYPVHPGRWQHYAPLRRHRPGAGHLPPAGRADGRPDPGRKPGGSGQSLLLHAAPAPAGTPGPAGRGGLVPPSAQPRCCTANGCWWWTTTPVPATFCTPP